MDIQLNLTTILKNNQKRRETQFLYGVMEMFQRKNIGTKYQVTLDKMLNTIYLAGCPDNYIFI